MSNKWIQTKQNSILLFIIQYRYKKGTSNFPKHHFHSQNWPTMFPCIRVLIHIPHKFFISFSLDIIITKFIIKLKFTHFAYPLRKPSPLLHFIIVGERDSNYTIFFLIYFNKYRLFFVLYLSFENFFHLDIHI